MGDPGITCVLMAQWLSLRGNQQRSAFQMHSIPEKCPASACCLGLELGEEGMNVMLLCHQAICYAGHCHAVCCPDSCLAAQEALI